MGTLYVVGTMDTKAAELRFAAEVARRAGADVQLVDVSTSPGDRGADVSDEVVAACHAEGAEAVFGHADRGQAVTAMAAALTAYLRGREDIGCVLGLGGTGNTALVTEAMRALPVGVPKLMVSTVASGNTLPYMGATDMAMMYSVVDIAGLNAISRRVIGNAARAAAAMAKTAELPAGKDRPAIGITMFGVTTPCVTAVRERLEDQYDCVVFHATGTGGASMEKLARDGFFRGLIDITTTEVADHLVGGVFACDETRFGAAIETRIPYVGSAGAVDMVNFGAMETVPERFRSRLLHVHNAHVTLMRTTPEENQRIGEFIVSRLNRMGGPVRFLLPLRGVSMLDAREQPFFDPEADQALFDAVRKGWRKSANRKLVEIDAHINDPAFCEAVVENFNAIT